MPLPPSCPHEGCSGEVVEDRVAEQFQEDLPARRTIIRRFLVHVGHCARCGCRVQGRHRLQTSDALGAAGVTIGPQALALAAVLQKVMGLSHAKVAKVLRSLGLAVTPGGITQALLRLSKKGEPTYEAMADAMANAPEASADETGWRIDGLPAWLWVFVAAQMVVYAIRRGRGFLEALSVLPEDFRGVLVRDGWVAYRGFAEALHQSCLAHLLRRCHELCEELPARHRAIPRELASILKAALGLRGREDIDTKLAELERRLDALLRRRPSHPANRRLLKHVANERDALFTFLRHGTDATNWRAEQAIRPAVVNRKLSGGNRSAAGVRAQEVLTSLLVTAELQGLDPVEILIDLQRSARRTIIPFELPGAPDETRLAEVA